MQNEVGRRMLSATVVGLLMVSALAVLLSGSARAGIDGPVTASTTPWTPTPTSGGTGQANAEEPDQALAKIDRALWDAALRPQKAAVERVQVVTTDFAAVREAALSAGASLALREEGVAGVRNPTPAPAATGRLVVRELSVPQSALIEVAKLSSTVAVNKALEPKLFDDFKNSPDYQEWVQARPLIQQRIRDAAKATAKTNGGPGDPSPNEYSVAEVTGSRAVNASYGITGDPVNIMVLDTGTDFGHPAFSLSSKWATVPVDPTDDAVNPWDAWPIMMDAPSLELYMAQWDGGLNPYPLGYTVGESTWFADTAFETTLVGSTLDATVDGDPVEWMGNTHRIANDAVEPLNTFYDLTDFHVSGGYDAALDMVGWFSAWTTAPLITDAEYLIYVDTLGTGQYNFELLYDNNYAMADQIVDAATNWETSATLVLVGAPNTALLNSPTFHLDDGTVFVEGTDYTFDNGTGTITFMESLYPGHILYADYDFGYTNILGPLGLAYRNLDTASEAVYLNGDYANPLTAGVDYTINYAMGTISLNAALVPGDVLEVEYTYNAGGDTDPLGYNAAPDPAYFPEFVVYWQPGMGTEPDVYNWVGTMWDGPYQLSTVGGESMYSAVNNFAELFMPKAPRDDASSINIEMFSADTAAIVDVVSGDATPLDAFLTQDGGFLPYQFGLGGQYTKRTAPDYGDLSFINRNYYLDPNNPDQASLSGTYHFGVHPDDYLTGIWGERVGLVLVDPTTPNVYDTIFVDLDNDRSFADEKAVTQADPAVWQDVTGDMIPDISGGVLYWMPDPSVAQPTENPTVTAGSDSVQLSEDWVAVDFFAVIGGDFDFPTVTLNGTPLVWGDDSADGALGFTMDLQAGIVYFWTYNATDDEFRPYTLSGTETIQVTYRTGTPLPYTPTLSVSEGLQNFIPENGDIALFYGEFNFGDDHGTMTASAAAAKPYGAFFGIFDVYGTAEDAKVIGANFAGGTVALEMAALGYDGIPGTGDEAQIVSNSWGYSGGQDIVTASGWDSGSRYVQYLSDTYPETTYMFAAANEGWGYGTVGSPAAAADAVTVGAASIMNYRVLFSSPTTGDRGPWGCWPILTTYPCGPYGDMADFSSRGPTGLGQPKPDILATGAFGLGASPLNSLGYWEGQDAWTPFASGTSWATPVAAGVAALTAESYYNSHGSTWPTNEQLKEFLMSGASDHRFDSLQQGSGFVNAMRSVEMASTPTDIGAGVSVSPGNWVPGGYPTPADTDDHKMFVNLLRPGESDTDTFTLTNHDNAGAPVTVSDRMYTKIGEYSFDYIHPEGGGPSSYTFAGSGTVTNRYSGVGAGFTLEATDFPAADYAAADFMVVQATSGELDRIAANGDSMYMALEVLIWVDVNDDGIYDGIDERTRLATGSGFASQYNVMKVFIYNPAGRLDNATSSITEGFILRMQNFGNSVDVPLNLKIEFYQRTDWSWVSVSPTSVNVPAGGTATFDATATVPAGTAPGGYQGVLLVTVGGVNSVIPVLINVPETDFPAHLGDTDGAATLPATSLYEPTATRGAAGGQYTLGGDLRKFFVELDIDTTRPDRIMIYNTAWQDEFSDLEFYAHGQTDYGAGSIEEANPDIYGPFTLTRVAGSKDKVGGQETLSGPYEFLSGPLTTGLMLVSVEMVQAAGNDVQEEFSVDIGMMETLPTAPAVSTNQLAGGQPITFWSNVDLIDGLGAAVTESSLDTFTGMPLAFSPPGANFAQWLCDQRDPNAMAWTVVPNTISINWHVSSPLATSGDDHDLGVFFDADGNGVCDYGVDPQVGQDADGDADEQVSLDFPTAGVYLIQVGPYASISMEWSLTVTTTIIGVSAFSMSGCPDTTIAAGTVTTCDLAWDFLGSTPTGVQTGSLFLSPGYAPYALAQKVAISWRYDTAAPAIGDLLPVPGSSTSDAFASIVANVYDNSTRQIDWRKVQLWVDGVDVTPSARVIAPYTNGYNAVTLNRPAAERWSDGVHSAMVRAWDYAGNLAQYSWQFTVDTTGPAITLTDPTVTEWAQTTGTASITGTTEPGATVDFELGGLPEPATVDSRGAFTGSVSLGSGENLIDVVARDALGNENRVALLAILDDEDPSLSVTVTSEVTNADQTTVRGRVDETAVVTVNGMIVPVLADGSFQGMVDLVEGANVITATATDTAGRTTSRSVTVNRITAPPTVEAMAMIGTTMVTGPISDASKNSVDISGTVTAAGGAANSLRYVNVNGQAAALTGNSFVLEDQALNYGSNVFYVQAVDAAGNTATTTVTVTFTPLVENVRQSYNTVVLGVAAVVLLVVGLFVGMMMGRGKQPPEAVSAPAPPMEGQAPEMAPPPAGQETMPPPPNPDGSWPPPPNPDQNWPPPPAPDQGWQQGGSQ